ncbi:hypothetical protein BDZ89DRAFT_1046692 [Hymenopellis radicata]|nr:hypothetical protein BDZ89DRAFT_1046692 [Hymenopellis radicata]
MSSDFYPYLRSTTFLLIFNQANTMTSLVPLSTIILGFSSIFGNAASTLFKSLIFIFSTHLLFMREFRLFASTFRRVDGQEIVAPTRCWCWKGRVKAYVAENNRDWSGRDLNIDKMEYQNAIHVIVAMEQLARLGGGGRGAPAFMKNLKAILEDLDVRCLRRGCNRHRGGCERDYTLFNQDGTSALYAGNNPQSAGLLEEQRCLDLERQERVSVILASKELLRKLTSSNHSQSHQGCLESPQMMDDIPRIDHIPHIEPPPLLTLPAPPDATPVTRQDLHVLVEHFNAVARYDAERYEAVRQGMNAVIRALNGLGERFSRGFGSEISWCTHGGLGQSSKEVMCTSIRRAGHREDKPPPSLGSSSVMQWFIYLSYINTDHWQPPTTEARTQCISAYNAGLLLLYSSLREEGAGVEYGEF